MTAPPAGALEACLALIEKADSFICTGDELRCHDGNGCECADEGKRPAMDPGTFAVNLLRTHGPALLAALRLREGCEGLVARIEREADAHTYFADNSDLRMTAGDHAKRAAQLTTIRDDLARVLEEGK